MTRLADPPAPNAIVAERRSARRRVRGWVPEPLRDFRGRSVLVVEDEGLIAFDLADTLESAGARVLGPETSVPGALRAIAEAAGGIDAAIIDINLQGEDSFAVAHQLQSAGVPFVFASGYSRKSIPDEFAGVPLCEKPLRSSAVVERLLRVCCGAV